MIDTIDDIEPPFRSGDSGKTERMVTWPSPEAAKRRIEERVRFAGEEGSLGHIDPVDLIAVMRELGRLTAENNELRAALVAEPASGEAEWVDRSLWTRTTTRAPPPPPTQGEEEPRPITAEMRRKGHELAYASKEFELALRQRADEATRAENEACALLIQDFLTGGTAAVAAAAIRARIAPEGGP